MKRIIKVSGTFAQLGDSVSLAIPDSVDQVALRLYEETKEIAIFVMTDTEPAPNALVVAHLRTFLATDPGAPLPDHFKKYIGAMGFPQEAYIVEISQ